MLAYLIESAPNFDKDKKKNDEAELPPCPIVTNDEELNEELKYVWSYELSGMKPAGHTRKVYQEYLERQKALENDQRS